MEIGRLLVPASGSGSPTGVPGPPPGPQRGALARENLALQGPEPRAGPTGTAQGCEQGFPAPTWAQRVGTGPPGAEAASALRGAMHFLLRSALHCQRQVWLTAQAPGPSEQV